MASQGREARRREWLSRAAFEAALILLGLLGALALNDWSDRRQRDRRVQEALASMRVELTENVGAISTLIAHNETLIDTLKESATTGRTYLGGLFPGLDVSSTAWDASKDAAISPDIPLPTLRALGRAYTAQGAFLREMEAFLNAGYSGTTTVNWRQAPLTLAGVISDFTRHAKGLRERYQEALTALPGQ